MKVSKQKIIRWTLALVLVLALIFLALNRQWVYDFARGMIYNPTPEMAKIHDSLSLTSRGDFLFRATWPKLSDREEFNSNCRVDGEEIAILGCYTGGNIFIFDITDDRLGGIRELTTAHELLHANFARMSNVEKDNLRQSLEKVYQDNIEILEDDLNTYDSEERFEELYVRAGTEVKSLPQELEKHYAEIFEDQDNVVAYYDKYISVFRAIEAELDTLQNEMQTISGDIDNKTAEYENRVESLNAEIASFNNCAETAGCFTSQWEFNTRRNALIAEQNALEALYQEIDDLIEEYNIRVEKYNEDVLESEKLNSIINSNEKTQEIE